MAAPIGLGLNLPGLQRALPASSYGVEAPIPERLHRGPRSLGVLGRFVQTPSPDLPPTLYTRDPQTNPLIPLTASPHLDLPLVHQNPALHLRAMKKRSIANRNFGVGNTGLEPFHGVIGPGRMEETTTESPTIQASPTMPVSPNLPEMPEPQHTSQHPLFASSIALSVIFGILLLGVGSWAAIHYTRKRSRRRDEVGDDALQEVSTLKAAEFETFAASNVVEKGLRPRTFSMGSSNSRPESIISQNGTIDGSRRVSFMDMPVYTDSIIELHDKIYGTESSVSVARSRMRSSTLSAIERSLVSSRPVSALTMSTLDPIEEETGSVTSSTSAHSLHARRASSPETTSGTEGVRPDSMASSATGSSAYTTASARSSISDLTTLSTMSCLSAFPETPRSEQKTPICERSPSPLDRPSKSAWNPDRKARARSQTVVNVKQIDLLRTAVGRTMSLQPSKQVATALQRMSDADNLETLEELIRGRDELVFNLALQTETTYQASKQVVDEAEDTDDLSAEKSMESEDTLVDETPDSGRPENGLKKVFFALDSPSQDRSRIPRAMLIDEDETPTSSPVTRSRSFPSKLLSRRSQAGQNTEARRSEVISGGYLKRALRALRGEEDSMPPVPGAYDRSLSSPDDADDEAPSRDHRRDSADSTMTNDSGEMPTSEFLDEVPFSPGWGDTVDLTEFDAYYTDLEEGFRLGDLSDEDESFSPETYSRSSVHLPHIRITSH